MKKLIILGVYLFGLSSSVLAQKVVEIGTLELFTTTAYEDSLTQVSNAGAWWKIKTKADAAWDTMETIAYDLAAQKGTGDIYIHASRSGSPASDSYIEFGAFRGGGYPDTTGYEWKHLFTFTTDTTLHATLGDSLWVSQKPFGKFKLRIRKPSDEAGDYTMRLSFWQAGKP